ncbi:MAG TPA: hypothetical protein VEY11_02445 [Pyrinomonadaceae bacterium]|nr:hypothetical protein [Pyrinomonadaceae bacterium]
MTQKHKPRKPQPTNTQLPRVEPTGAQYPVAPLPADLPPPHVEDSHKDDEGLHKDAFWLYGIIVGLAIREALTEVLPHIFSTTSIPFEHFLEGVRLLVFLILAIRFYLGSVTYFRDAYICEKAKADYSKKNYFLDFFVGFFHFLLFFALATSINIHERPLWLFPLLLVIVLFYDVPWLIINWSNDTSDLIKMWTAINFGTLVVVVPLFYGLKGGGMSVARAEEIALLIVLIVSMVDIGGTITGKQLFATGLQRLISKTSNKS